MSLGVGGGEWGVKAVLLIWACSCFIIYGWIVRRAWTTFMGSPVLRDAVQDGWRWRCVSAALFYGLPTTWAAWCMYLLAPLGLLVMAYARWRR